MSRRGYATETYERDYYGPSRERDRSRDYDEIDIIRRRDREPEYFRDDYGRNDTGALVLRERETETYSRPREPREPSRERERDIIVEPPIHQEIVTHHRHIDHGVERAVPPRRGHHHHHDDELEIIHRGSRNSKEYFDDDIIFERENSHRKHHDEYHSRNRSLSTRPRGYSRSEMDHDIASEADYYNRRVGDRAYAGEAYNGATRDWAIVDVPPGTERVTMDGAGGGSQEITWQRYNGVRRSKFVTGRDDYDEVKDLVPRRYVGEKDPYDDMWTEITKDLVVREAIEQLGYDFEETEFFFYVMEYLRYEDVLDLVQRSEDIRRDRRDRIREIQFERDHPLERRVRGRRSFDDERIIEREIIYEGRRPPPRGYLR
ncbi:MAG: hypothetical protein M1837_003672 [Sclerophora amabilis]|nr:MAG: hypothetical protein M1837_003672 [Sclerophora amabilis]